MINELYTLSHSLKRNKVEVTAWHPWIEGVKKGEALLVNVNSHGEVASVEYCNPDQVATFWYIRESNKQTFPKINLKPLWFYSNEKLLEGFIAAGKGGKRDQWLEIALKIIELHPDIACEKSPDKIKSWKKDKWQRLYKFPHEYLLPFLGKDNRGLKSLIESFSSWKEFSEATVNNFLVDIIRKLLTSLSDGKLDCFNLAQDLIAGRPKAKSQPVITVIFNSLGGNIIVADQEEKNALAVSLSDINGGKKRYVCPLSGKKTTGPVSKYPSPKLPVIGNAYLMAMNKATPCHDRYRKIGANVFPASEEVATQLDNVLRFVTDQQRLYKTWMPLASGKWEGAGKSKKEKKDLLIAFAEELPDFQRLNPNLALIMGGDSQQEQSFEAVSSIVCDALRKFDTTSTSAKLRFFVIRKISKGQSQIILNEFCSVPDLFDAVEAWKRAAANRPDFSLFLPVKKKAKRHFPPTPYPADLSRLLQYQWIRAGLESHKLDGCPLVVVYDLFFERGGRTKSAARQVLRLLLQRHASLLLGICKARQLQELEKYSVFAKSAALMAVSFLGISLFKLGIKKEVYMKEVGYNIGRLLSLTDCLHYEYCDKVRDGDIPNQLLGNTILRTVLDSPVKGLARLSERIPVYKAWIDRHQGEEYKLAHWAKNEMGKISEQLSNMTIPDKTDDAMKAQILLGYLAHTESKKK